MKYEKWMKRKPNKDENFRCYVSPSHPLQEKSGTFTCLTDPTHKVFTNKNIRDYIQDPNRTKLTHREQAVINQAIGILYRVDTISQLNLMRAIATQLCLNKKEVEYAFSSPAAQRTFNELMEIEGLTDGKGFKVLIDAMSAVRIENETSPDHKVRLQAAELMWKLKGKLNKSSEGIPESNIQAVQVIFSDKNDQASSDKKLQPV